MELDPVHLRRICFQQVPPRIHQNRICVLQSLLVTFPTVDFSTGQCLGTHSCTIRQAMVSLWWSPTTTEVCKPTFTPELRPSPLARQWHQPHQHTQEVLLLHSQKAGTQTCLHQADMGRESGARSGAWRQAGSALSTADGTTC